MYYTNKLKSTTLKMKPRMTFLFNIFLLTLIVFCLTFSKIICLIIFKELNPNFLFVFVNAFELKNAVKLSDLSKFYEGLKNLLGRFFIIFLIYLRIIK